MLPKLQNAKYQGDYRVWLEFADGVAGEIDLKEELLGEIFQPLKDKAQFSRLSLNEELGTIVWPNGADFAPEFLYQKLCPGYKLKSKTENDVA